MQSLPLLILSLITQETFLTYFSINASLNLGVKIIYIHLLWFIVTVIHMTVPFYFGRKLANNKKITIENLNNSKIFSKTINFKKIFLYLLLGIFNFVYINSFLMGIANVRSKLVFAIIFIGDLIWYLLILSLNLTTIKIFEKTQVLMVVIFLLLLFYVFGTKFLNNIFNHDSKLKLN